MKKLKFIFLFTILIISISCNYNDDWATPIVQRKYPHATVWRITHESNKFIVCDTTNAVYCVTVSSDYAPKITTIVIKYPQ